MKTVCFIFGAIVPIFLLAAGLWGTKRGMFSPVTAAGNDAGLPLTGQKTPVGQTEAKPYESVGAARHFVEMTARERRGIMRQIKAADADEWFRLFLEAGRTDRDLMKQSGLQGRLTGAIMEGKYSSGFVAQMKQFVRDESNTVLERGYIITAFAGARTKEGVEFVLWAISSQNNAGLRQSAISSLGGLGGAQPYLPEMIEPLWHHSDDPAMLKAVAMAMAREAAPSSIEPLLLAASAPKGQDDVRRMAAFRALPKVYRKEAVPALAGALESAPPGSLKSSIALSTLSQIGDVSAA